MVEVVGAMMGEEVSWPEEEVVDFPSVRLTQTMVKRVAGRHLEMMEGPFGSRLEGIVVDREEMRDDDS
ncbi:hypothetical protein Tco_1436242 [Tanacetum coccineum]